MGKHTLQVENDYDFVLIGILSYAKDYRICWALNNRFGFELTKTDALEIKGKKKKAPTYFSLFKYENQEDFIEYSVLANLSEGKLIGPKNLSLFDEGTDASGSTEKEVLIPEYKQMNYFFVIKGEIGNKEVEGIIKKMKEIDLVQTAVNIEVGKLKSKQNLIF